MPTCSAYVAPRDLQDISEYEVSLLPADEAQALAAALKDPSARLAPAAQKDADRGRLRLARYRHRTCAACAPDGPVSWDVD